MYSSIELLTHIMWKTTLAMTVPCLHTIPLALVLQTLTCFQSYLGQHIFSCYLKNNLSAVLIDFVMKFLNSSGIMIWFKGEEIPVFLVKQSILNLSVLDY